MESEAIVCPLPENLSPALTEKLKLLAPGTYCLHRSWGFGKIKDWDVAHESVIIDFKSKHGHVMQFAYAAESLTPLAPDHVSVQKVESASALSKKALEDPWSSIRTASAASARKPPPTTSRPSSLPDDPRIALGRQANLLGKSAFELSNAEANARRRVIDAKRAALAEKPVNRRDGIGRTSFLDPSEEKRGGNPNPFPKFDASASRCSSADRWGPMTDRASKARSTNSAIVTRKSR